MLDGKRYYAAFPDEDPHKRCLLALLNALGKFEAEFRKKIQPFLDNSQANSATG